MFRQLFNAFNPEFYSKEFFTSQWEPWQWDWEWKKGIDALGNATNGTGKIAEQTIENDLETTVEKTILAGNTVDSTTDNTNTNTDNTAEARSWGGGDGDTILRQSSDHNLQDCVEDIGNDFQDWLQGDNQALNDILGRMMEKN